VSFAVVEGVWRLIAGSLPAQSIENQWLCHRAWGQSTVFAPRNSAPPRLRVYFLSYVLLTRSGGGENRGGRQKIFDNTSMDIGQSEVTAGVSIG